MDSLLSNHKCEAEFTIAELSAIHSVLADAAQQQVNLGRNALDQDDLDACRIRANYAGTLLQLCEKVQGYQQKHTDWAIAEEEFWAWMCRD